MKAVDLDLRSSRWAALRTLIGAYLNQDFAEEYGDSWSAVRAFAAEAEPDYVGEAATGAHDLGALVDDEDEARAALDRLGIGYAPWRNGWTCRGWLAEVEGVLRSSLQDR